MYRVTSTPFVLVKFIHLRDIIRVSLLSVCLSVRLWDNTWKISQPKLPAASVFTRFHTTIKNYILSSINRRLGVDILQVAKKYIIF